MRISFITLGAADVANLRAFYRRWGWSERAGSSDTFASFDAGRVRLALYPLPLLAAEAAPGDEPPRTGWNGTTLAVNVDVRAEVDAEYRRAVDAGARPVAEPVEREWGGYSGYVADPEGQRWEIAWAPAVP